MSCLYLHAHGLGGRSEQGDTMTLFRNRYRIESARLTGWDYRSEGWYFVTVCTVNRECLFGEIIDDQVRLSMFGETARQCWEEIPHHFQNVHLDEFVIMPNHLHGILSIHNGNTELVETRPVETRHVASLPHPSMSNKSISNKFGPLRSGSLQAIIHAYKSAVTRWCRKHGQRYVVWQPRFYDHIIRSEESLNKIREYILDNPAKWVTDREHLANLWI